MKVHKYNDDDFDLEHGAITILWSRSKKELLTIAKTITTYFNKPTKASKKEKKK